MKNMCQSLSLPPPKSSPPCSSRTRLVSGNLPYQIFPKSRGPTSTQRRLRIGSMTRLTFTLLRAKSGPMLGSPTRTPSLSHGTTLSPVPRTFPLRIKSLICRLMKKSSFSFQTTPSSIAWALARPSLRFRNGSMRWRAKLITRTGWTLTRSALPLLLKSPSSLLTPCPSPYSCINITNKTEYWKMVALITIKFQNLRNLRRRWRRSKAKPLSTATMVPSSRTGLRTQAPLGRSSKLLMTRRMLRRLRLTFRWLLTTSRAS